MSPGTRVYCQYREPNALQPWVGQRYVGVVLALDDPRAWVGRNQDECTRHVAWCQARGLLSDGTVPVLYPFGLRWDSQLVVL